ncbi:MAG: S8 family serine peptidase, partial [Pseudomonadota bacterium]|nr:S8 family serine peptidase [Pseudomonadota bacterium]
ALYTQYIDYVYSDLRHNQYIEYIEPDYIIRLENTTIDNPNVLMSEHLETISTLPNDPEFKKLWHEHNSGQSGGTPDADIDAPEAWNTQTDCSEITIAVIDTGVDYNHPDLKNNMWRNRGEIPNDGIDNDGNFYDDDIYGWDFAYNSANPMDNHSHGTHVAGAIAAQGDNNIGISGVCWSAKIMALKFLNDAGFGNTSDAIKAIEYAANNGAQISNNSWGGGGYVQALYETIAAAGTRNGQLFIAAAGNSYGNNNDKFPFYPASYELDNIISVAATDHNDVLAQFSNYGLTSVDLAAPGVQIYSTLPNNSYGFKSGTSMATPQVSGAAALLWASLDNPNAQTVKQGLLEAVDAIDWSLGDKVLTGGRLNAYNALPALAPPPPPAGLVLDSTVHGSPFVRMRGAWQPSTELHGFYAHNYLYNDNPEVRSWIGFTPEITEESIYKIHLYYPAHHTNASKVRVVIRDYYGTAFRYIDQRENGSDWVSVGGYFYFKPGLSNRYGSIKILNVRADGKVIADAVAFEPVKGVAVSARSTRK